MDENFYQAPSTPLAPPGYAADDTLPPGAVEHLLGTQMWARLISVVGILLTVIWLGVMIWIFDRISSVPSEFGYQRNVPMWPLLIYAAMALLIIYPLIRLGRYASSIGRLRFSRSVADFQDALYQQRLFWRFVGITVAVVLTLILVLWLIGLSRPSYRY